MKGYPKSRFDIINQTQIQEIDTATKENPVALYMMPVNLLIYESSVICSLMILT